MRNRIFCFLIAALMLAFPAFAQTVTEYPLPHFIWERNGTNHWQLDENGDITGVGAHIFDEGMICTVCGSDILDWSDGTFDVTDYDEYGNPLRYTSFDADGAITYESIHVYEYNEDGVVLIDLEFLSGVLYGEIIYTVNADGEQVPVTQTAWNDDGTISINYYDEHGNCVRSAIFEADGTVINDTLSEYALDDYGWYYEAQTTTYFNSGEVFYTESNQYGDPIRTLNTEADGTPWADYTYEYEYKNGVMVWKKQYDSGRLSAEEFMNEDGYSIRDIYYEEDGSSETWLFDDIGDVINVTYTLPDGSVDRVEIYEYEYTEDMDLLWMKVYCEDKLIMQTEYLYDEELGLTNIVETSWNEDGSRTVCEYDDWFELLSETTYAADGSVIE